MKLSCAMQDRTTSYTTLRSVASWFHMVFAQSRTMEQHEARDEMQEDQTRTGDYTVVSYLMTPHHAIYHDTLQDSMQ